MKPIVSFMFLLCMSIHPDSLSIDTSKAFLDLKTYYTRSVKLSSDANYFLSIDGYKLSQGFFINKELESARSINSGSSFYFKTYSALTWYAFATILLGVASINVATFSLETDIKDNSRSENAFTIGSICIATGITAIPIRLSFRRKALMKYNNDLKIYYGIKY